MACSMAIGDGLFIGRYISYNSSNESKTSEGSCTLFLNFAICYRLPTILFDILLIQNDNTNVIRLLILILILRFLMNTIGFGIFIL